MIIFFLIVLCEAIFMILSFAIVLFIFCTFPKFTTFIDHVFGSVFLPDTKPYTFLTSDPF